ncbi:hypothetical protein C3486_12920 [Streptomyces sp. Ru73]|uniref:hypothetical protein n=1 Tax=Streptomyces sp. Ru73 TaxID=2080748 RepID=UPI000CDD7546|nr:hypothetical protein [Streptomyces sp. Ru73]POX40692.1 hypothetical protein C3486_12920 [Streptomyces sp. Ru73]
MSATQPLPGQVRPSAAEVNDSIRSFVQARRGCAWTPEDRAEYARLLADWTSAMRDEVVTAA